MSSERSATVDGVTMTESSSSSVVLLLAGVESLSGWLLVATSA